MNKMIWLVVIVALLVGAFGGFYYERTKMRKLMTANEAMYQSQVASLKSENAKFTKDQNGENMAQTTPTPSVMKEAKTTPGVTKEVTGMEEKASPTEIMK